LRRSISGLFVLLILTLNLSPVFGEQEVSEGVLVDEVVAVVNRQVITRSEVWEEAVLILVEQRGREGLRYQITPVFLEKVLDMLINQQVLLDEARRVGLPAVSEHEQSQLLEGFRSRFPDREGYVRFLLEHGIDESRLSVALVRHLRVEWLKENKLRVMPEVTDVEVRQYYDKHRRDFGSASLKAVAAAIRVRLSQTQQERELARWLGELGKRSEVKVLVDLSAEAEDTHGS
jgi:hypothetical protein